MIMVLMAAEQDLLAALPIRDTWETDLDHQAVFLMAAEEAAHPWVQEDHLQVDLLQADHPAAWDAEAAEAAEAVVQEEENNK